MPSSFVFYHLQTLAVAILLGVLPAAAREIVIPRGETLIDGQALGVQPGDHLLIEAGERPFLKVTHVIGTREQPVIIRPHGGVVTLRNPDRHYDIFVGQSRHFHLTGAGPGSRFGFHLAGTNRDGSALMIAGLSSDFEIDHLQISHAGFAGMLLKTDGAIGTVMEHVLLHDNYVHDIGGEGFYIGETKSPGQELRHIQVWNNVTARTGYEGFQLSNVSVDAEVHHNVFYRSGIRRDLWQDKAVQIGPSCTVNFHDNLVIGAESHLAGLWGGRPKDIRNNYFAGNVTAAGISIADNSLPSVPDHPLTLEHNVFRDVASVQPIILFQGEKTVCRIAGNTWEGANVFVRHQPIVDLGAVLTVEGNQRASIPAPRFVDEAHDDFHLRPDDPYRQRGMGLLPE